MQERESARESKIKSDGEREGRVHEIPFSATCESMQLLIDYSSCKQMCLAARQGNARPAYGLERVKLFEYQESE